MMQLNDNNSLFSGIKVLNARPNSSLTFLGDAQNSNSSGDTLCMYSWASVPGYSAFGQYTAVNNAALNPFVYTGFRPAFLLIKSKSNHNWLIQDTTRSPFNPANLDLYPDRTVSENVRNKIDFLCNGFRLRESFAESGSNHTYIYAAFAENPFGGENVSPANAR